MQTKIQKLLNLRLVTRFITRIIKEEVNWTRNENLFIEFLKEGVPLAM